MSTCIHKNIVFEKCSQNKELLVYPSDKNKKQELIDISS